MDIFKIHLLDLKPVFLASYKITRVGAFFDIIRDTDCTFRSRDPLHWLQPSRT